MILTVTGYGTRLSRRGNCILIEKKDGTRQMISAEHIESILLTENCGLTSEVISLCMEHDISFAMQKRDGSPGWSVESFSGGSAPILRRKQLTLSREPEGLWVVQKLQSWKQRNRSAFLRQIAWQRGGEKRKTLLSAADKLEETARRLWAIEGTVEAQRGTIMGLEGSAGHIYFSALSTLPELQFAGRCTLGAQDYFNSLLNYGYGILYQRIKRECLLARLDPYIGILHTDQYNRPTLTYDCIEPFRVLAEKAAVLCCKDGEHGDEGLLTKEEKQRMIQALMGELDRPLHTPGKRTWGQEITRSIQELAAVLREQGKEAA